MAFNTAAGSKISIGTTTEATTQTEYESDTYTQIGVVEDLGEFGDQYNVVTFTSLADARVQKRKGSADAGDMTVTVAFDGSDAGQQALKDALDDTGALPYNVKVELNDAVTSGGTPTVFYFSAFISSRRVQVGTTDDVVRGSINFGITTSVIEVEAT